MKKIENTSILIIEGIIVLNDPEILKLCDLKFFIKIDKDVCWNRRKSRVWDPEGSCWEESPGYFEDIAWPEYVKCLAQLVKSGGAGDEIVKLQPNPAQTNSSPT